jgi:hypothetical protein
VSLVLAAAHGRRAIVASDGAVTRRYADGFTERVESARPKFRLVAPGVALAFTGPDVWMNDLIHQQVDERIAQLHGAPFDDILAFLAARLPDWHRMLEERTLALGMPALSEEIGAMVALIGLSGAAKRARMVLYTPQRHYVPYDSGLAALGVDTDLALSMLRDAASREQWEMLPTAMRHIIDHVSKTNQYVGGSIFTCQIEADTNGEPTSLVLQYDPESPEQ